MDIFTEKLLTIHRTAAWAVLPPKEIDLVYKETKIVLATGLSGLDNISYMSLIELHFYLSIIRGEDVEAESLLKTVTDQLGEDSPRIHLMKATLIQVTQSDDEAKKYIEDLLKNHLEIATDSEDYLQMKKKLLTIERPSMNREQWVKELMDLVEKFPLDAEIWSLLAYEYQEAGNLRQAIYCTEEVILAIPFNYEAFGQLAFLHYLKSQTDAEPKQSLQSCLSNALRSVELAEAYVKGWGIVLKASEKLNKTEINKLAIRKLQEIQRNNGDDETVNICKYLLDTEN
ncbi:unnamed protein product [Kluyveromyces dobzhanskii CBS 2104]|uniref:ER membrane protein complex subunit 2 n=1 Tax=Kluyveromyces dobzhanskii CBS 2104 TaxID=1427455 RepID=A0A0A8L852_9SACH|nr:unnamed protein product [Kluyveromyces dobzhanskii CBS 2104]